MNLNQKNTSFLRYLALNTLWEGVSSETLQYCLLIGSNVQAIAFTIYRLFTFVPTSSTGTLSYIANRLIKLFLIKATLVDGASQEGLLITHILAWLYNGIIAGFLVLAAVNKYRNRNLSTKARFSMMILFQFHLCFGFAYIILILLNTIINSTPRETLAHSYGGIILTIDIASVTLSTLVGLFAAAFSYDPFLSKNFLSCRSPSCQFIIFVYKVLLCPATYLFVGTLASTWIMNIGTMILFTARHFYLFKRFPYYNYATMRISITLSTICLVISWVNLVILVIKSISTTNLTTESILYVEIILIFLSLKFWNICFLNIARKHLILQNKELKSEDQIFIKFFALRVLMGASKMSSIPARTSIFYWGAYHDFIQQQQTEKGIDWNKLHNYSTEEMRKLTIEEFQLLGAKFKRDFEVDFMKEAVERMKNSRMATVLLVNFLMDSIDSLSTSVFYLTRLTKSQVFEGVIISKFYEKVQHNVTKVLLENKGSDLLDVQKYIDSEFVSRDFLNLLTVNAKSYADYWTYYEEQNMAVATLFEKNTQIEQQSKKIHYYWTKYVEMNKHISKSLVPVYSYYQSLVNNRPVTAAKLLKKHQAIYDQNLHHIKVTSLLQSDLNDPNILILQASMSREKLGVIRNVSSQISEILGWTSKDIVGRNVSIIMPGFVREPHHQMLQKHLQNVQNISSSTRINRVTESFVLNREGYVVPCEVYISIHPYILEELVYIAIIKVKEMKESVILLSEGGYVEGLSYQMEKSVGQTQGQKLHMQEICKNYKEIENIVKMNNSSPVSLVNNDRKFTGISFNDSPIIKPTTFNDLEHTSITLTLVNFETSRKKRHIGGWYHYSTVIKQSQFFQTRFYVLKLTLDVKSQVFDDSSSDEVIPEIAEENSIPSEKNSEEGVVPYSFRKSRSTQFLTYKSDSHRGLLEPTNFLSFQSNVSPKAENKTSIQNVQINEIDSMSSQVHTRKNINRKQDKQRGLQIILHGSQEGSVALGENYDAQMEEAVNSNPKTEHLSVIKWIGMIWIFVIPFTLLWIQLEKNTVTSLVNGNIDFTSQATQLLANVVELNRATRYIILDDMGLISVNKYGVEAKYVLQGPIIDLSVATNKLSNSIRNSLDKIDINLRKTAYGLKVPIIDVNAEGISTIVSDINVFDFIIEIVSRGIKLGNIPISHLNGTLPEVSFIVDNTLNEFLVIWEQMRPLLVEDSRLKLRTQETLIGALWGVISVIGLVILAIISDALKNFRKKRDHLLNILLRLDDRQILKHTQRVQKFVRILEKGFVSPSINEKIEEELFGTYEAKSQSSYNIKKSFKIEGINSTLYRRYALVFAFFLAMVSIYIILFALARSQSSLISNKINLMVQSYDYYYHTTLASAILYDYVQNNITTTVRNRPIQEELDSLFSELSQVQNFYVGTMISKKTRLTSNQTLYDLVQGNICSLYDFGPVAEEICTTTNGGILKNGVVGLNSYFLATFESLTASFENSPRAFSDMYALMNSPQLILEEVVQYLYLETVYNSLDTLIRSSLQDDQDRYMKVFEWIITVFSILCFSIAWGCWVYIIKAFELEMILWMKMIRQVPWDVLVSNKLLKAYLVKNNGIASSVNN